LLACRLVEQQVVVMTTVQPVRWGILGAANIAVNKVIPAMRASRLSRPVAIASRDLAKARQAAERRDRAVRRNGSQ